MPITTLLRALPAEDLTTGFQLDTSSNEKILELFGGSTYIANTLDKDPTTREEEALIEVFKKQRPGEPPTLDNARNLLRSLFVDPKRYDLTRVGRYKLNQRLGVQVPEDTRVLTTEDILALVRRLVDLPTKLGLPEDAKDFAADPAQLSRDPIRGEGEHGVEGAPHRDVGLMGQSVDEIEADALDFTDEAVTTGIYKYRLNQVDFDGTVTYSNEIEVEVDCSPKEFVLYQNYPNPFNPNTRIKFTIKNSGFITLKVYNGIGQEIIALIYEEKSPGTYEFNFNASGLPSGIYFAKMTSGNQTQIIKMSLLK